MDPWFWCGLADSLSGAEAARNDSFQGSFGVHGFVGYVGPTGMDPCFLVWVYTPGSSVSVNLWVE